MKQKLFTLLLAVAASVGTMFAWDYENVQIGDLYYNLDATTQTAEVTCKSWNNFEYNKGWGITTANIPATVTYSDVAYSVTNIGEFAFCMCRSLTSVTIPNSVTSIGGGAFYMCSDLTSVTIPNSVTSIGELAFLYCSSLTSPVFNAHVFAYMPTSYSGAYTIPDGIESIAGSAFNGCSSLTSVTIPNSVTSIEGTAFRDCTGLTSVTIPNSVISIGDRAFQGCSGLTSPVYNTHVFAFMPTSYSGAYTIPDGIESIAGGAFSGCTGLTSVTIGNSVTGIGNSAFYYCTSLTSITIPNSVTSIGNNAFYVCKGLTSVTIPNSVTSIGYEAFRGCSGLTSVMIPNSVTSIGDNAFYNCSGLTSPVFNAHVFAYMPTSYSGAYTIPDGIESIAGSAFCMCRSLTSVTIPNSVTSIGSGAFEGCSGLTSVTIEAEIPPTLGNGAFSGTNDCPIYVPCGTLDAYKTAWSYSSRITHSLSQECIYTISTTSANLEWGTTAGDTAALYLDEVEISAIPNYGYRFVRWNDGNTSNPRTVSVTEDKTFIATFAKNVYSITKNAEHGSISGNSSAEYLDFVTLTVTPNYGYHFTQWSDGLKDNPRIAQITQDTTFTAEFAYDRVGTCGKDLALVWSYDPTNKVLTIGNAGSFTENMQFGVEAPNEMEELVIGNSVTAIGANAFAGIETLKKVSIGESVKTIGEQAFFNCVNLETIFNYRPTPTNAYSTAFDGVDKFECVLYVLPSSIDMYKNASVWRDFYYTYAIGAEEATVTTNDVKVEPQNNAATVTWPTSENAASYTIQITKDGVLFCTLVFNANGQLTGIAFAPSRDGQAHAPQAIMTANGLQFTVTGLDSGTQYGYNLTAKDANDQTVATYSGSFTTTSEGVVTGVDNTVIEAKASKILHNGQIFILRGDKTYTLQGQEVK